MDTIRKIAITGIIVIGMIVFLSVLFSLQLPGLTSIATSGKDSREKIEHYSQAIVGDPDNSEYYLIRGLAYLDVNQHQEAIQDFSKAIELNPTSAEAYYGRAIAYSPDKTHDIKSLAAYMNNEDISSYPDRIQKDVYSIQDYFKAVELDFTYIDKIPCGPQSIWYSIESSRAASPDWFDVSGYVPAARPTGSFHMNNLCESVYDVKYRPNGQEIGIGGDSGLWLSDRDGTTIHAITNDKKPVFELAWNNAGDRIAWISTDGIFVYDFEGKKIQQVTDTEGVPGNLQWSPDGRYLSYYDSRDTYRNSCKEWGASCTVKENPSYATIFVIDSTQKVPVKVATDCNPSGYDWDPVTNRIVYSYALKSSSTDVRYGKIVSVNPDGTDKKQIIDSDTDDISPQFSSDGTLLVYLSGIRQYHDIVLTKRDGSNKRSLRVFTTSNPGVVKIIDFDLEENAMIYQKSHYAFITDITSNKTDLLCKDRIETEGIVTWNPGDNILLIVNPVKGNTDLTQYVLKN